MLSLVYLLVSFMQTSSKGFLSYFTFSIQENQFSRSFQSAWQNESPYNKCFIGEIDSQLDVQQFFYFHTLFLVQQLYRKVL